MLKGTASKMKITLLRIFDGEILCLPAFSEYSDRQHFKKTTVIKRVKDNEEITCKIIINST